MKHALNTFDSQSRRQFVERCAATALGLSVVPMQTSVANEPGTEKPRGSGFGQAQRVIVLQLQGGLSHIDSFDYKYLKIINLQRLQKFNNRC